MAGESALIAFASMASKWYNFTETKGLFRSYHEHGCIGKKKKINDYWTITESQETPYFGKVMPFWEYNLFN